MYGEASLGFEDQLLNKIASQMFAKLLFARDCVQRLQVHNTYRNF